MSSSSSSSSSSSASLPSPTFCHIVSVKLYPNNYLFWKVQVVPYLRGQRLFKYVDGTCPPPSAKLANGLPNPDHEVWFQHDQFVMSALISFLSESIIEQVIGCSSTRQIWLSLESTYASASQARLIQTQLQLASLKKGPDSIQVYYQRAKILADTMAAAGRPLPSTDFIPYLLAGLGPDYDVLVTTVTARMDPISTEAPLGHLLAHEA